MIGSRNREARNSSCGCGRPLKYPQPRCAPCSGRRSSDSSLGCQGGQGRRSRGADKSAPGLDGLDGHLRQWSWSARPAGLDAHSCSASRRWSAGRVLRHAGRLGPEVQLCAVRMGGSARGLEGSEERLTSRAGDAVRDNERRRKRRQPRLSTSVPTRRPRAPPGPRRRRRGRSRSPNGRVVRSRRTRRGDQDDGFAGQVPSPDPGHRRLGTRAGGRDPGRYPPGNPTGLGPPRGVGKAMRSSSSSRQP